MASVNRVSGLLAGAALGVALAAGGSAKADDEMTWAYASARVGTCTVGQGGSCSSPGGLKVLGREASVETNTGYINASVHVNDYRPSLTPHDYGVAWASAEAGEGLLALPVLKAYALGGGTGFGSVPNPTIAVNAATVQAIQGYTNTGSSNLIIPLNAFTGVVDYEMFGPPTNPGTVRASLAVTTDAILDPAVSAQWFGDQTGGGFGQFTGGCGTPGALAVGAPAAATNASSGTQYLPVTTSSCTGFDTFTLNPGETFYVWATLTAIRSAFGATDVSHTFNITINPEVAPLVEETLAPSLALADGGNLSIPTGAVPEPSAWAMMIVGFGGAGAVLRRRRRVAAA